MNDNVVIDIENLTKIYKLYDNNFDRLKEALSFSKKIYHKDFYALKDIMLKVFKGESLGIIGKNGSGKSTLLKLIVGIIVANEGKIFTKGKIAALLELGAGFNPEYTGLQNIYLQGTIFGFDKSEMDLKIENIINFADIGEFISQPVKNYSSGMFARLAFAVAINVEPEILIVDEALSVGDIFFQNKCFKKMEEIKNKGTTILFVSHDMFSIKQFCDKAIWLENGKILESGSVEDVCTSFQNSIFLDKNKNSKVSMASSKIKDPNGKIKKSEYKFRKLVKKYNRGGTGKGRIISFSILNLNNEDVSNLKICEKYKVRLLAEFYEPLKSVIFGFSLETKKGIPVVGINTFMSGQLIETVDVDSYYDTTFEFSLPKIQNGEYIFAPAIAQGTQDEHIVVDWIQGAIQIFIENDGYNISLIEIDSESTVSKYLKKEVHFSE